MKMRHYINSHKGVTGLVMLLMIALYDQWENPTAWVYFVLHGTYGLLWVLKSQVFPDKQWEQPTTLLSGVGIWAALTLYWIGGWMVNAYAIDAPGWWLALCILLYSVGLFYHFVADMQKYITLAFRPGQLITNGLFAHSRNPNYFGEMLIYAGFGLLSQHWLPSAILALWVVVYWLPNMRRKDRSLSRYPDFVAYAKKTKLFIPFLF